MDWRTVTRHFWQTILGVLPSWMGVSVTARQSDALTLFAVLALPPAWTLFAPRLLRRVTTWLLGVFNIDVNEPALQPEQVLQRATDGDVKPIARKISVLVTVGIIVLVLLDSAIRVVSLNLLGWIVMAAIGLGVVAAIANSMSGQAALGCIFVLGGAPVMMIVIFLLMLLVTPGHMILQMFEVVPTYGFLYQLLCLVVFAGIAALVFLNAWYAPLVMPTALFYLGMVTATSFAYSAWTDRGREIDKYINVHSTPAQPVDSKPVGVAGYCKAETALRSQLDRLPIKLNLAFTSEIQDRLNRNVAALDPGPHGTVQYKFASGSGELAYDCNLVVPRCVEGNRLQVQVTEGFLAQFLAAALKHEPEGPQQARIVKRLLSSKETKLEATQPILQRLLDRHELQREVVVTAARACYRAYVERIETQSPPTAPAPGTSH